MIQSLNSIQARYKLESLEGPYPIRLSKGSREDLAKVHRDLGFKVGAEIGVHKGLYSRHLCNTIKGLKLYCVDPWLTYAGYDDYKRQSKLSEAEAYARDILKPFDVEFLQMFSEDAAKEIPDNSLDFVFIDGNHTYEFALKDLEMWSPKVKSGGIVSGHDYYDFEKEPYRHSIQVIQAVNEFTANHQIAPWFVYPEASFFWVKP